MDYSIDENTKKKRKLKSKAPKIKNKAVSIIIRAIIAVILIGGFACVGAVVGAYLGIIENAPELKTPEIKPNIYTSIIYAESLNNEVDRLKSEENREYVSFDKIPVHLRNAFIAIEDARFYSHNGIDFKGMLRALYVNLSGSHREGASTITQQLIKNSVMKINRNTMVTKLQEQYLAIQYEKVLSNSDNLKTKEAAKDYILEVYLNTIALGHNQNGVQTAAMYYFNKPVSELNIAESAVIAATTQNPVYNAPDDFPETNRKRQLKVLENMLEFGMIDQLQYDAAVADDVYSRVGHIAAEEVEYYHSYYIDRVVSDVSNDLQEQYGLTPQQAIDWIYNKGLKIITAQDMEMQEIVDNAFMDESLFPSSDLEIEVQYYVTFKNGVTGKTENKSKNGTIKAEEEKEELIQSFRDLLLGVNDEVIAERSILIPQPQMAMAIIDYHTGEVKAITGGRGDKSGDRTLNRATDSPRQPGSVFKVLASYLPAIDLGKVTPATVIDDAPYTYGSKEFKNWYSGYRGLSTVRTGIRDSMNILAVKTMVNTGIDTSFDYLLNLGFTTLVDQVNDAGQTDRGAATALGGITYGVTQLEVTAAFGTIANAGEYNKPVFYKKVFDHDGKLLLENNVQPRQVIKSTSAYLLTNMMQDVVTSGTGGKARFKEVKMPIAGKTGTTTDTMDLAFVGYTPYYAAGVWLGYDYPKTIREDNGAHMRMWSYVMEEIHKNLPYKEFERPEGIISAAVCKITGNLSTDTCRDSGTAFTEIFAAGTQPKEYCSGHINFRLDTSTNFKAGDDCPEEHVITIMNVRLNSEGEYEGKYNDEPYIIPALVYNGSVCIYHGSEINPYQDYFNPGYYIDSEGNIVPFTPVTTDQPTDGQESPVIPESRNNEVPIVQGGEQSQSNIQPTPAPTPTQTPVPDYNAQQNQSDQPVINNNTALNMGPSLPVLDEPLTIDGFSY